MRRPATRLLLGLILLTFGPTPLAAQELALSAAVSLKEAVEELGRIFRVTRPGLVLRYNFGGSGALQQQIEAGAPVDLFISAGQQQADELERKGLIVPASRRVLARNLLAIVTPEDSRFVLAKATDLLRPEIGRIALGNPKTVPAGQYAEAYLRSQGVWEGIRPKLVFAEDVRQALTYVARGEVEAGFVYVTDVAAGGAAVREVFRPVRESYPPIAYPVAVITGSRQAALGTAFIESALGPAGQAVLGRLGFQPGGRR